MNTKAIGDITTGMVLAALLKSGRVVLMPFGDNQPYDLAIDSGAGTMVRVQCKTGRIRNGAIIFNAYSQDKTGKMFSYKGKADFFGVYCRGNEKCYLVPVAESGVTMWLRLEPSKNGQVKRTRSAVEYEIR